MIHLTDISLTIKVHVTNEINIHWVPSAVSMTPIFASCALKPQRPTFLLRKQTIAKFAFIIAIIGIDADRNWIFKFRLRIVRWACCHLEFLLLYDFLAEAPRLTARKNVSVLWINCANLPQCQRDDLRSVEITTDIHTSYHVSVWLIRHYKSLRTVVGNHLYS
jgi:hypothetical protein